LHGLKNPLAGLQAFIASGREGTVDDSQWQEADAAAQRMRSMIHEILDLLREDEGFGVADLTLREVTQMVAARVRPTVDEHRVRFELQEGPGSQSLPSRVGQLTCLVLVNLVENAIEATPPGGVVQLSARASESGVAFQVRDQGPGISEPQAARIFTPGQTTKANGSGLGLALCRQIARHLGAELTLIQNNGSGCAFELLLPPTLAPDPAAAAATP
jgi:two-component system sensor histidine kinase FlrB